MKKSKKTEKLRELVTKKINIQNILVLISLILIMIFAYVVRSFTSYLEMPSDYDPWWWFRYAKEIVERWDKEKKFVLADWDELSHFPPGRPAFYWGYSYTLAISYILLRDFVKLSLEKFSVYFVAVYAAITAIPCFFLIRYIIKSNIAALFGSFLLVLSPAFITTSMAGYVDLDVVYVLFTHLTILSTIVLFKKFFDYEINFIFLKNLNKIIKILPYFIVTTIVYILFAWNWIAAFYFLPFIFLFILIHFITNFVTKVFSYERANSEKYLNSFFSSLLSSLNIFILVFLLIIVTQLSLILLEKIFNANNFFPKPIDMSIWMLSLLFQKGLESAMLVNKSVAELQKFNLFSKEGIETITSRIGGWPIGAIIFALSIMYFPILLYKFFKKNINWIDLFLLSWFLICLFYISQGVRFILQFTSCLVVVSSYVLIFSYNFLIERIRSDEVKNLFKIFFFSLILVFLLLYLDVATFTASRLKGSYEVSKDWLDALNFLKENSDKYTLVATWWDPGVILAGYAGVRVHADGMHCGKTENFGCIPFDHNIRIQDMGRILTTQNETEAYEILKKYTKLSEEDCKKVKEVYPTLFREEICNITIKKIYFIASNDLIFKFYWPYYFSSCLRKYYPDNSVCYTKSGIENFFYKNNYAEGKMYSIFILNTIKSDIEKNYLVYTSKVMIGDEIKDIDVTIRPETFNNQSILTAYLMNKERIRYLVYYSQDQPIIIDQEAFGRKWDRNYMVIIDPTLRYLYIADDEIKDSLFTKMYFLNGSGLEKFKLVFSNYEVKIYEVLFS